MEFPGGKQEQAKRSKLARELKEELGIEVKVGAELISVNHAYSHKKLRFVVHFCDWMSGEPQPLVSQQVRWVRPDELGTPSRPPMRGSLRPCLVGASTRSPSSIEL